MLIEAETGRVQVVEERTWHANGGWKRGRGGENSLWHQLQRGQGLLIGRPTNQSEYTRGEKHLLCLSSP